MQRKATRQSRGPNAAEKRHMAWIKERNVCMTDNRVNGLGVIAHHCEGATFKHNKIQVGHWFVIGLCETCDGFITQGSRKGFRERFGAQSELWLKQLEEYPHKHECPEEVIEAVKAWGK